MGIVVLMVFWSVVWLYLVGALVLGGVVGGGWWLWRTDRFVRGGDWQWRHDEAVKAGYRMLCEVDVAIFVATMYFSGPAERFATENDILAVHRDHLGLWNKGASLVSLGAVNGLGQGDRRDRERWKKTYE